MLAIRFSRKFCFLILFCIVGALNLFSQINPLAGVVDVTHEKDAEGNIHLFANNTLIIPVVITIDTNTIRNMRPTQSTPYQVVVPAQRQQFPILSFNIIDQTKGSAINYKFLTAYGNPFEVNHADDYQYIFPFAHGTKHEVSQSHSGAYSHNDDENRYAIDFNMPISTLVYAARDGIVVLIKEDSNIGGKGNRYGAHANYITIMHNDGSFASYVHLQQNGALVRIGEQILRGQQIGLSGNTGNSSGPHLHFDVQIPNTSGKMQSIPVGYVTVDEIVTEPQPSYFYYAQHPDQPRFAVQLGREIAPESFTDYIRAVEQTDDFDFRTERIDNTFIAFLINGTENDVMVQLTIQTSGVQSVLSYPQQFTIPALSEIFCGIFHTQSNATQIRISPTIKPLR